MATEQTVQGTLVGEWRQAVIKNLPPLSPKAKPNLPDMLSFKGKKRTFNLAEQIGTNGKMFGVQLLNDTSGALVDGIMAGKDAKDANFEILKKWLEGKCEEPVVWSTLTKALRKAGLVALATEVEETLNIEGNYCSLVYLFLHMYVIYMYICNIILFRLTYSPFLFFSLTLYNTTIIIQFFLPSHLKA